MARPLRICYPNAWYHVMNRGAGGKNIFQNDNHRYLFLDLLKECHLTFNIKACAYCLMDNHYHLLLSTPNANLSRAMRHLNGVYTQKYNKSLQLDGPLFRGRFRAQLIEDDQYKLIVSRYIHLNPVKAGLVSDPADYKWSSYRNYLGLEKTSWLAIDDFSNQLENGYKDYVIGTIKEEIDCSSPILGSESFKKKILYELSTSSYAQHSSDINRLCKIPEIDLIIKHICMYYKINLDNLIHKKLSELNLPKLLCIFICNKIYGHTLKNIANKLGLKCYSSVSTSVTKFQNLLKQNSLQIDMQLILKKINSELQ